jgi:type VI protein secretion system component Hcp
LQAVYIAEIEKANNYLKMVVCQQYERLHTSERFKDELISKINHIENRGYFMKKIRNLQLHHVDSHGDKPEPQVEFKMDFDKLKQRITKTAEIAESYFQEKFEARQKDSQPAYEPRSE